MLSVLAEPRFRKLFIAQIIALIGTGLLTVALSLLAYGIAGSSAGSVLGIVFTIKMIAYVGLSPFIHAVVERLPRRVLLVGANLTRAGVALCLPFVTDVWQIYVLVFVLQSASAAFTPAFQAVIPDILEDEADYTRALSLSRLAYDLENLLSPALAGAFLLLMPFHGLFVGTGLAFVISAALVLATPLPSSQKENERAFKERLTRGLRIYLATPRLRGLLAVNLTAASAGAFVLVNTVVVTKTFYGEAETLFSTAMAAFGAGSMVAALILPSLLDRVSERPVMIGAATALALVCFSIATVLFLDNPLPWSAFLVTWLVVGALYSAILTPAGRLLRRSTHADDRPSVFTAQFALSHACWLVTYPTAGFVGDAVGLPWAMATMGTLGLIGVISAFRFWPAVDAVEIEHDHSDLPVDHPHLVVHAAEGARHRHKFVIDDEHRTWPTRG